ncbi:MAG: AraC family transcriptional regulator [Pseudomonadota bacterium]
MPDLISPRDLPTWVPGEILSRSDTLGWNGIAQRSYRYRGMDVDIPPMDTFMVVDYCRGRTPMDRKFDGRWTRAECRPGNFSLLTRSARSHWHWTEDVEVSHVYVSMDLMSRVAIDMLGREVGDIRLHDVLRQNDPVVTGISREIAREAEHNNVGGPLYVEALGVQLAVHLLRHYAIVAQPENDPSGGLTAYQIRRLKEFVDARLHERIGLEDLAGELGLGVWTFSRRFRRAYGRPAYAFVIDRRLARAQDLLRRGRLAVKQVAASCGFSDQAHMTRMFRARLGVTPAQFRQQV